MKKTKILQVLLLSSFTPDVNVIKETLDKSSFQCNLQVAEDENKYRLLLAKNSFDIILADYDFPFLSAPDALKLALAHQHHVPCIVISGLIGEHNAVELIKEGAVDVVIKDRITSLPSSVSRAIREVKMIKELQKAKSQLRHRKIIKAQNTELKKINDAKDKFFSIIAHDLKTPLNSLLGFSELLVNNANEKRFDECERIAEIIHHSSILATTLLSNLLSWAQTQVGSIEFHPEDFIFSDLVQQVSTQFIDAALFKNITIKNEMPPDILVHADKDMLATVLRNLLSNAVKFTHPGGTVRISCRQSPNEITFKLSDTGVGIPQNKIRDLFQIGSATTTTGTMKETGSGIGLILCKEFISQHKGKIWAESSDKGSDFYFSIPAEHRA